MVQRSREAGQSPAAVPVRRSQGQRPLASRAGLAGIGLLAAVWIFRSARRRTITFHASVTVNQSSADAYRFWRNLENLPRFMAHLVSVRMIGDGRSQWVVQGLAGHSRVRWTAEIIDERPHELIAWRSLPGAKVPNSGTVRFAPAPGGRGTEVRVELCYAVRGGATGRTLARLLGAEPEQQVRDDLRRFKQVIETGEVLRSDASPGGTNVRRQVWQRPARPLAAAAAR